MSDLSEQHRAVIEQFRQHRPTMDEKSIVGLYNLVDAHFGDVPHEAEFFLHTDQYSEKGAPPDLYLKIRLKKEVENQMNREYAYFAQVIKRSAWMAANSYFFISFVEDYEEQL